MLNRKEIIKRVNPVLTSPDIFSPLSVGNGSFTFTADITGLQTLWEEYKDGCPVLTMSEKAWHSAPLEDGSYPEPGSVAKDEYDYRGRKVHYPVHPQPGNEEIYKWLRENPHRVNLMRLRFFFEGEPVSSASLSDIRQQLDLYTGVLYSEFKLNNEKVTVETACGNEAAVSFRAASILFKKGLTVRAEFPYPSPKKQASDFSCPEKHETEVVFEPGEGFRGPGTVKQAGSNALVLRKTDREETVIKIFSDGEINKTGKHELSVESISGTMLEACFLFTEMNTAGVMFFDRIKAESIARTGEFWEKGGFISFLNSEDKRATELQRRVILSMYLTGIQCSGSIPPQETGLTINSWSGKFHLEMHPIHAAWLSLYRRGEMLEKSLSWYESILPKAKKNAMDNGFKGARWPKQVGPEGVDSPSVIAPLLIWQQPHLIFMIELLREERYGENTLKDNNTDRSSIPSEKSYKGETEADFIKRYRDLIYETALFMADFAVWNGEKNQYELLPPIIPVQERFEPIETLNPAFETAYFSFGLRKAYELLKTIGDLHPEFLRISDKMAHCPVRDNLIQAHDRSKNVYTEVNTDHPSMFFQYGMLDAKIERKVLIDSLKAFEKNWDFGTLWGWDFAFLSMVYSKLGMYNKAFDMLLLDTPKNTFVVSGNNAQADSIDLPLYLPGNGSLLMALTLLKDCPGWKMEKEGIIDYPF